MRSSTLAEQLNGHVQGAHAWSYETSECLYSLGETHSDW